MMGKVVKILWLFLAVLMVALPTRFVSALPRIAVLDLKYSPNNISFQNGFEDIYWDEEQNKNFTVLLSTVLSNTKKFEVVERNQLSRINTERVFSEITTGSVLSSGGFGGANYCIIGEIKNLTCTKNEIPIPYSEYSRHEYVGKMSVLIRMINIGSGKIIVARLVEVEKNSDKEALARGFLESLLKETAEKSVSMIIEGAYPPKISSIDGSIVYINRGLNSGYKIGTILMVYEQGKEIIDPDTKQNLGYEERPLAEIKIIEILDKVSKAEIVSGNVNLIKSGMVCRVEEITPSPPPKPLTPGSSSEPIKWE